MRWVVLQVEETSAYCTVNNRASASNYQLSNMKSPARDSNWRLSEVGGKNSNPGSASDMQASYTVAKQPYTSIESIHLLLRYYTSHNLLYTFYHTFGYRGKEMLCTCMCLYKHLRPKHFHLVTLQLHAKTRHNTEYRKEIN